MRGNAPPRPLLGGRSCLSNAPRPAGLAQYAAAGETEEAATSQLLADFTLMRDMLVAGGTVATSNGKGGREEYLPKKYGVRRHSFPSFSFLPWFWISGPG